MKKKRGAITLFVLLAMMFFIMALISLFVIASNRARAGKQLTGQIQDLYNTDPNSVYNSYFGGEVVPIYTTDQLLKVGSNEKIRIEEESGKIYTFAPNSTYVLKNNLEFSVADYVGKYPSSFAVEKWTEKEIQKTTETLTNQITNFDYKAAEQIYTAPATGKYKLQVWGAQGGYRSSSSYAGYGGYSIGEVNLAQGEKLYVYTGGSGNTGGTSVGGFNGGGTRDTYVGGGGGSDIRIGGNTLYHRAIVAGGGGSDGATSKRRNVWWRNFRRNRNRELWIWRRRSYSNSRRNR